MHGGKIKSKQNKEKKKKTQNKTGTDREEHQHQLNTGKTHGDAPWKQEESMTGERTLKIIIVNLKYKILNGNICFGASAVSNPS